MNAARQLSKSMSRAHNLLMLLCSKIDHGNATARSDITVR